MEIVRLIFVDILIPIVTLVLGFFGGKTYQIKIIEKRKQNKDISLSGDRKKNRKNNELVNQDKIEASNIENEVSGENNLIIITNGKNSQAAGRDIINGEERYKHKR